MKLGRTLLTVALVMALAVALVPGEVAAKRLADSFIRIEINDTDGDAGIHVFLDGEGWDSMQMTAPGGAVQFNVLAESSVGAQGITEFFFESAEPSFDVQTLDELLALFPEGKYKFTGTTTDGEKLRGKARLNHCIPAGPVQVFPLEDDEVDPDDATFVWEPVADPPGNCEIVGYEVIVVCEDIEVEMAMNVGADVTSVTVPPEFLDQGGEECKWEVLAKEDGGNQTISEVEFGIE